MQVYEETVEGVSEHSFNFILENLPKIGKIKEIEIISSKHRLPPRTTIFGENGKIIAYGLNLGYRGIGTFYTRQLLKRLFEVPLREFIKSIVDKETREIIEKNYQKDPIFWFVVNTTAFRLFLDEDGNLDFKYITYVDD